MKAHAGTGKRKGNSHNKRYWGRLKKQFKCSAYDHTGAYSELRQLPKSPEMMKLERQFELASVIMEDKRYKNLRERMAFGHNSHRLGAVMDLKVLG